MTQERKTFTENEINALIAIFKKGEVGDIEDLEEVKKLKKKKVISKKEKEKLKAIVKKIDKDR